MYLFFQLPEGDFSNYLTHSRKGGVGGPALKHTDGRRETGEGSGGGRGVGLSTGCRQAPSVGAVMGPQSQELLEACEARADTWWGGWQTPGGETPGGEAQKQQDGWGAMTGPSSMLAGAHAFSGTPTMGLRLHRFSP